MREETSRRIEWLEATILVFENKLRRGVYNPSHFIYAIRTYKEELKKLKENN